MYNSEEMTKQEIMEALKENGPEWSEAFMELVRSADGATPEQIGAVVEFLEQKKTVEAEARLRELIEEGKQIMKNNVKRELSAWGLNILKEISEGDMFTLASNAFLIGVATGHNTAINDTTTQGRA